MLEEKKVEAQQVLDELFKEHHLPFSLSAYKVESLGLEEYIIRFHDSRLRSVDVSCPDGESFKDLFRQAVLARMKRMSGPLPRTAR